MTKPTLSNVAAESMSALPHRPIDIWVLVFPNFLLLDATGPLQVFSTANDEAVDAGLPSPYRLHVVAHESGVVVSNAGIGIQAKALPVQGLAGSTVIVAGGRLAHLPAADCASDRTTLAWIERAAIIASRCCSICTGSFVLARAGLLDGRRAVTHWQDVAQLRQQHPAIEVLEDAVYVQDGKFYSSAGISAGMDLALRLVESDLGAAVARAVAKRMLLFVHRPGGQSQFSADLLAQSKAGAPDSVNTRLLAWLRPRLRQHIDVGQMAAACSLSIRTLHRRLRQEAGVSPAQLLTSLRLSVASSLLEQPGATVKQAARQSGFDTEYNLRRAFMAQLGVLLSDYQARFRTPKSENLLLGGTSR